MLVAGKVKGAALLGITDQAVYSLTNLALAIAVAQVSTARNFGAFTAFFVAYTLLSGLVEAICGEAFIVHHSGVEEGLVGSDGHNSQSTAAKRAVAGLAVAIGLGVGSFGILALAITRSDWARTLAAFGVVLPFLLLQNVWRSVLFAEGRPGAALVNDLTWALAQAVAVGAVIISDRSTVPMLVIAWGIGAVFAAVLGVWQTGTVPAVRSAASWVSDHGRSSSAFGAEFLSLYGASQAVFAVVAAIAGLEALANIRVAQLIFSPLSVLVNGARVALTPFAVGLGGAEDSSRFRPFVVRCMLGLGGLAGLWGLAALAIPDSVWSDVFADSWPGTQDLLLPFALSRVFLASGFGAVIGMRAMAALRASLVSRTTSAALAIVGGSIGAILAGAVGAAWGLFATSVVGLGMMWRYFVKAEQSQQSKLSVGE